MSERVCGKAVRVEMSTRRAGDPAVLIGSSERARTLLGWKPTRSDLRILISDAWKWMNSEKFLSAVTK
jgi:UDP-glucose 4-epimerase